MKIVSLPSSDRPREKALAMGMPSLTDAEVLALLLGKGTVGCSALELSQRLLKEHGGLSSLSKATLTQLKGYPGIKEVKALTLLGVFELAKRIRAEEKEPFTLNHCLNKLRGSMTEVEELYVLMLDKRRRVKSWHLVAKGDGQGLSFSTSEILRHVLSGGHSSFALVHLHPSEYCLPSPEDIQSTTFLSLESKKLHCQLIDHVILTKASDFSFEKNGLLH